MDYPKEKYLDPDWENKEVMATMPLAITQEGIAKAVGIHWNHVSRAIKEFEQAGLVVTKKANIEGGGRRRNVYFLTDEGCKIAGERLKQIRDMYANVIINKETINVKLGDLYDKFSGELEFVDMIRDISNVSEDVLDLDGVIQFKRKVTIKEEKYVKVIEGLPAPRHFFGRESELNDVLELIKSDVLVIVIQGIVGIGKSAFVSKLIESLTGKRNIYYYQFHEWDTLRAVLTPLSNFLSRLNKHNLKRFLQSKVRRTSYRHEDEKLTIDLFDIFEIIKKDFDDLDAVLIFDDLHKVSGTIESLFSLFLETLEKVPGPKIIVLTRSVPTFYTMKDLTIKKTVVEYRLGGLDPESSRKILEDKGLKVEDFDKVYEVTGGHPLCLELMSSPYDFVRPSEVTRFVYKEILAKLNHEEKVFLGKLSVFRSPVLPEAFIIDPAQYDILDKLLNQILIEEVPYVGYKAHDLVREMIHLTITSSDNAKWHVEAADYYLEQGDEFSIIEAVYHLIEAKEYEKATEIAIQYGLDLINKGYLDDLKGNFNISEDHIPERLKAEAFILMGSMDFASGEWDRAIKSFESALNATGPKDKRIQAYALRHLGHIARERGEWDRAMDLYKKNLSISEEIRDLTELGETYRSIGKIYWRKGDRDEAEKFFNMAIRCAKEVKNELLECEILIDMAANLLDFDNDTAIKYCKTAIESLEKLGAKYELPRPCNTLGVIYYTLKDLDNALNHWQLAIKNAEITGNVRIKAWALLNIADIYASKGEFEMALKSLRNSTEILLKIQDKAGLAFINMQYGILNAMMKKWDDAENFFQYAINDSIGLGLPFLTAESYYEYGQMYRSKGDKKKAISMLSKAIAIYKKLKKEKLIEKIKEEISELADRSE